MAIACQRKCLLAFDLRIASTEEQKHYLISFLNYFLISIQPLCDRISGRRRFKAKLMGSPEPDLPSCISGSSERSRRAQRAPGDQENI